MQDHSHLVRAVVVALVMSIWPSTSQAQPQAVLRVNRVDYLFEAVAHSADGTLLAAAGNRHEMEHEPSPVLLFDARTGRLLRELGGHEGKVSSVAFSPDGKQLASAGKDDCTARVWDVATGRCVAICRGHTICLSRVVFSGDSRVLATSGWDGTVRLWDPATGKEIATLRDAANNKSTCFNCVLFSMDNSKVIASGTSEGVTTWDVASRKVVTTRIAIPWAVAISPDARLAAITTLDDRIRVVEVGTGRTLSLLSDYKGPIWGIAFSTDGKLLAASCNETVRVWDTNSGACRAVIGVKAFVVNPVSFSHDGRSLTTAGVAMIRTWPAAALLVGQCVRMEAFPPDELAALRREGAAQRLAAEADLAAVVRVATGGSEVLRAQEAVQKPRKRCTVVFRVTTCLDTDEINGKKTKGFMLADEGGNPTIRVMAKIPADRLKAFHVEDMGFAPYVGKWVAVTGEVSVGSEPGLQFQERVRCATIVVTEPSQIVVLDTKVSGCTWLDLLPPVMPPPPPDRR